MDTVGIWFYKSYDQCYAELVWRVLRIFGDMSLYETRLARICLVLLYNPISELHPKFLSAFINLRFEIRG